MNAFPQKLKASALGEEIEYIVAGRGAPTIVLVNGSGGPIEGWHKVFQPLSEISTTLAYNRPGIGGSTKPQVPQTTSRLVASLRSLLQSAQLPAPYLLVGHSLGGLIVNLFARLHPTEVAAVVMIEATSPDDVEVLKQYETKTQRFLQKLINAVSPADPNAETSHVNVSVAELQAAPAFPPVPLIVVTGGKPAMSWATAREASTARSTHQQQLVSLSPKGQQIIAARSGHFPQFTEPELLIGAVRTAFLSLEPQMHSAKD